jgi:hypothetical protein
MSDEQTAVKVEANRRQSATIGKLALALSKAQGAIRHAAKDGVNPYFRSSYATLASVREAYQGPFAQNELALLQTTDVRDGRTFLVTTLAHSSGEWVAGEFEVKPTKDDPQGMGSAMTYARRYTAAAIAGVAPDEDDDGEAASGRGNGGRVARKSSEQASPQKPGKCKVPTQTELTSGSAFAAELKRLTGSDDDARKLFDELTEGKETKGASRATKRGWWLRLAEHPQYGSSEAAASIGTSDDVAQVFGEDDL